MHNVGFGKPLGSASIPPSRAYDGADCAVVWCDTSSGVYVPGRPRAAHVARDPRGPVVPYDHTLRHAPRFSMGPCIRSRRVCLTSWSFWRSRWAMGQRRTVHFPRLVVPHMCGKPRSRRSRVSPGPPLAPFACPTPTLHEACLLQGAVRGGTCGIAPAGRSANCSASSRAGSRQ